MAQPHPTLKLPGFTKTVTLSTGVEVIIKRLNIEAYTVDAAWHVLSTPAPPLASTPKRAPRPSSPYMAGRAGQGRF